MVISNNNNYWKITKITCSPMRDNRQQSIQHVQYLNTRSNIIGERGFAAIYFATYLCASSSGSDKP